MAGLKSNVSGGVGRSGGQRAGEGETQWSSTLKNTHKMLKAVVFGAQELRLMEGGASDCCF